MYTFNYWPVIMMYCGDGLLILMVPIIFSKSYHELALHGSRQRGLLAVGSLCFSIGYILSWFYFCQDNFCFVESSYWTATVFFVVAHIILNIMMIRYMKRVKTMFFFNIMSHHDDHVIIVN